MELVSPAGTPEALDAAIASGADAVYLGLKSFNARLRSANFAYSQAEAAIKALHSRRRKVYITVNTVFEERETDRMYQLLKYLASVGPDALIVQDYGVIEMARRCFPSLKLHASTQMNIASARGANFLSKYGVSRVVLARELSFDEIKAIRENTNTGLEVFVHGALCVSVSGLCLFSSFLGGKSANRGMCTQACRRLYRTAERPDDPLLTSESGYFFSPRDLQLIDRVPLLYEAGVNALKIEGRMKSAEYVGTVTRAYRLVIDACASGGEAAIESAVAEAQEMLRGDYARRKTRYHFDKKGEVSPSLRSKLKLDPPSATPSAGGRPPQRPPSYAKGETRAPDAAEYLNPQEDGGTGIRLGVIRAAGPSRGRGVTGTGGGSPFGREDALSSGVAGPSRGRGVTGTGGGSPFGREDALSSGSTAVFLQLGGAGDNGGGPDSGGAGVLTVMPGDSLRFHRADDSRRATHKAAFAVRERNGVWVSAPEGFGAGDIVYLIQRKTASRRYPPVLPENLAGFRASPGRDKAPEVDLNVAGKKEAFAALFPAGFYVAVENAADLYIAQSVKTEGVILPFKETNVQALLGKRAAFLGARNGEKNGAKNSGGTAALPYRPGEIIISMPPFFPESRAEAAEKDIRRLVESGYTRFIVNNAGQIAPLKSMNAALVAGPYLYAFNRYSAAFLQNAGLSSFVSPFETSRQNLERVFGGKPTPEGSRQERSETARIKALRARVFLTLYVRPKLFQIAANLRETYDFGAFFDKEGGAFRLSGDPRADMSYVVPETPFSLTDKVPYLKSAGWSRFILDFTPAPLKKFHYKDIMQAAQRAAVLPCARFNWKDGFFKTEENR